MKKITLDVEDCNSNGQTASIKNANEIKVFETLDHINIVKYIESFNYKSKLCIIMEYADGGNKNIFEIYKIKVI